MSEYNGWTNWETWNLYNWLSDGGFPEEWAALEVPKLAELLRDQISEPIDAMPPGWSRDVLTHAVIDVNWHELAAAAKDAAA